VIRGCGAAITSALPLRRSGGGLFAPAVWAGHFLTVYASEVLACHQAAPRLHDVVVVIATLAIVWHPLEQSFPASG
jgi:hypothetical protein